MFENITEFYFFLDLIAFLVVICMHIVKTNRNLIRLYLVQSVVIATMLVGTGLAENEKSLVWIGLLTLLIKGVVAPLFFGRLMHRFGARFTANNYLSMSLTLTVLMVLVMFAYSNIFQPLGMLVPEAIGLFSLNLAIIFISIFLLINRRGAFAQMIGILSLENSILLLATIIGVKQHLALEMGVIFDIAIWMIIAHVFISMIYKQFGSLNIAELKKLIEE